MVGTQIGRMGGPRARALLAALLALLVAASIGASEPAQASGAVKADRDGDKIFDDLEAQLESSGPNESVSVIVVLNTPASAPEVRALERAVGSFDVSRRFSIVPAFAATMTGGQVRDLATLVDVQHVELNSRVQISNDTAEQSFGVTKARLDAPSLDGDGDGDPSTYSAADLVAAVLDSGIDTGHRDLDDGKVLAFQDFVNGMTDPYDDNGHGTHVAATIAGDGDARPDLLQQGVAPAAALVGVKVVDSAGDGDEATMIAGIEWSVANKALFGIEALNLSLGLTGSACSDGTDAASLAVDAAEAVGLVVVVAAGNEGPGTCTVKSPGAAADALTVGAMADLGSNGFYDAFFSSRGPTGDGRIKPDVTGPGVNITSARAGSTAGYVTFSGTSMATAFVTGVTLLMLDANPGLSPVQVKDDITQSAVDWARGGDNTTTGSSGADIDYGAGRLDAYAAIEVAGASINTPPELPGHQLLEGNLADTGSAVDYTLPITSTQFPIAATLILPEISGPSAASPDFDLFLFDPDGVQVAGSGSTAREEQFGYQPQTTGTYTLRVSSFAGGGDYLVDVSRPDTYPRPGSGTPLRVPLVPAFVACTEPNATHAEPLDSPSCTPPVLESTLLTTSKIGRGGGFARLDVIAGDPSTADDEADVRIFALATNVQNQSDGSDYDGKAILSTTIRITDRANGPAADQPATTEDARFSIPVDCIATGDPMLGGSCSVDTSTDTLVPGFAREGKRAVISAFSVELLDAGPDSSIDPSSDPLGLGCPPTCGSGDESVFLRQGVFVP
jgi:serine protease AprX